MTRIYLACSITKRFFNERALTTVGTLLTTFLFSALLHAKPGDLDTSGFAAPTGRTSFSLNSSLNHVGRGIVVQPDGKIVVAGACPVGTLRGFCVARYESDGNIDTSYGDSSGLTATAMSTLNAFATAAAAQQDGKIVVVGACEVGSASNLDFCLARYTTAGILDSTFNSNGKVITNTGTGIDEVNAVVIQTDGKIVVAGGCRGTKLNFCVLRYNSNGSPDSTFGTSGRVTTSMSTGDDFITAIALQSDGKLVVFGACNFVSCLARYVSTNGALDTTFDGDGKLIDPLGVQTGGTGFNASGGGLVIQLDGKIVTGGRWAQSGTFGGTEGSFALRRYEASGATDTTFGNAGTTRFDVTTGNNNTFVDQM